jgi:hypothetical protein
MQTKKKKKEKEETTIGFQKTIFITLLLATHGDMELLLYTFSKFLLDSTLLSCEFPKVVS